MFVFPGKTETKDVAKNGFVVACIPISREKQAPYVPLSQQGELPNATRDYLEYPRA